MGGVILLLAITSLWNHLPLKLPAQFGEQTLLATVFYMSGYIYRKIDLKSTYPHIIGSALFIVPAVAAIYTSLGMDCKGSIVWPYYGIAICGTVATMQLSRWLSYTRIASLLGYIGDKTLYILIFHFLAFKIISFLHIYYNDLPVEWLSQFPVIREAHRSLWMVYTIAGISLPMLVWELLHRAPKVSAITFDRK